MMRWTVFVRSITTTPLLTDVVEASNGGNEGPPFVRFQLPAEEIRKCHIGKSYILIIEDATK